MRQVSRVISTYTADVSGVCSALYELGGMVVMHDPSGCNSTYNTHDEPRWYDMDSLIFISGLAEIDAIMGNDDKLIDDVATAAKQLSPRFIALARTPIPMLNGTDFDAIAVAIERRTGIPTFYFPTNGTHSYVYGAQMALEKIADYYTGDGCKEQADCDADGIRVNLLGVTPLDFSVTGTVDSMKKFLEKEGFSLVSCMAMGSSLEEISQAGWADVNLVVSSVGLPAAQLLYRKFKIPYVVGVPVGAFAAQIAADLRAAAATGESRISCNLRPDASEAEIALIGESVLSGSVAAAVSLTHNKVIKVICPLETEEGLLAPGDILASEEEEIEEILKGMAVIIADPLYRPICPKQAKFYDLPHEAFSGRIFRNKIPDFVNILQ